MPPPYPRVKVLGERNSGTNFVELMLRLNFRVDLLPNAMPFSKEHEAILRRIPLTELGRDAVFHRATDLSHQTNFRHHAGWKHAALTERHFTEPEHADQTLFLCVLRHPAPWLISMFRAPFATFQPDNWPQTLREFLDTPWVTRFRDELEPLVLESPARLWALKTASYLDHSGTHPNAMIVRHEDLLRDHETTLSRIGDMLERSGTAWKLPRGNARQAHPRDPDTERDFWQIRDQLPEDPFAMLDTGLATDLFNWIGSDLLAKAGYAPPSTDPMTTA